MSENHGSLQTQNISSDPIFAAPIAPLSHQCAVLFQRECGARYRHLRLHAPQIAQNAQPGQYLHLLAGENHTFHPLLRRAFSVLQCGHDWVEILYRIEGIGTQLLARKREGDRIDVLGPLGKPFHVKQPQLLLVGGGVGVPPLFFLARRQYENSSVSRETSEFDDATEVFIGARCHADVLLETEMRQFATTVSVTTEDGSRGEQGFVTAPLARRLEQLKAEAGNLKRVQVCACGPLPMLRAVAQLCERMDVACDVSLEENMPCGIGVCNGCVVPVRSNSDDYGQYRRICVEGPVMDARDIVWSGAAASVAHAVEDDMADPTHRGASQ